MVRKWFVGAEVHNQGENGRNHYQPFKYVMRAVFPVRGIMTRPYLLN